MHHGEALSPLLPEHGSYVYVSPSSIQTKNEIKRNPIMAVVKKIMYVQNDLFVYGDCEVYKVKDFVFILIWSNESFEGVTRPLFT